MKNPIYRTALWSIFCTLLLNPSVLQADAWVKHRRCNWIYKEWKTRAWVDYIPNGLHINADYRCNERAANCDKAESDCYWSDRTRTRAYAVGGDKVKVISNEGPFTVELLDYSFADHKIVQGCGGLPCTVIGSVDRYGNNAAGFARIMMPSDQATYHITKPFLEEPTENSRGHISITDSKPVYNEVDHTVVIKNIKGILEMNALDIANDFTAFTISVTHEPPLYTESKDPYVEDKEYIKNLVWSSTAMLNNGRVLMNGALEASFFKVTQHDGPESKIAVELTIDELIIPIPKDISLEELSVNFGVDGGNLGYGISEKFIVTEPTDELTLSPFFVPEEVFTFENYPNAVSDVLNIKIKLPYSKDVNIVLMDVNGNMVKQIYQGGIVADREVVIQKTLNALPGKNGLYFLVMELDNQILVRKVLVNR